jgi:hypothetical protein
MRILSAGNEGSLKPHLEIYVLDEPGPGGANHKYRIAHIPGPGEKRGFEPLDISFQKGAIEENGNGINGIAGEALMAILIDRMQGFASGPFPSRETSLALTKLQEALHWLEHRTKERVARGVEGKHEK